MDGFREEQSAGALKELSLILAGKYAYD